MKTQSSNLHSIVSGLCLCAITASAAQRPAFTISDAQKKRLDRALAPMHGSYNPETRMISSPFSSPGYHTTLKGGTVHSTRAALNYAVALLDTGDEELRLRACDILDAVIALQDADPESRTCGVWPWFLEEPLSQMSPPDFNWADFCGAQLLQVALDHRGRIPPELMRRVDAAIILAARAIERRDVGPGYTNIAIMGAYVTYVAGELYGLDDLKAYAAGRLRRFHEHTKTQGSFSEYNSPTYTIVALEELARMRLHIQDADALPLIDELSREAWRDIALHFHAPTRQWAGPHRRCYDTLLARPTLATLQNASNGALDWGIDRPSIHEQRLPLSCPPELIPYFQTLDAPRETIKTYDKDAPPLIGTTWMEPAFTLGSASREDFWNQRRAILAYWGGPQTPAFLRARFLRDGYDFADAQLFTSQRRGDLIAAVNLGTDGGNTHVSLDRIAGEFTAADLRLRFEFGGAAATDALPISRAPWQSADTATAARPCDSGASAIDLRFGDLRCQISVPYCQFDGLAPRWESGAGDGKAWLDLVLYSGADRVFDLTRADSAALGFTLRLSAAEIPPPRATATLSADGRLTLELDTLRVTIPVKPAPVATLQHAVTY